MRSTLNSLQNLKIKIPSLWSLLAALESRDFMNFNWILIRYGEISLKSDYVRRSFEDRLINNIRKGLETRGINGKVERGYGRIFIRTEQTKEAIEVLKRTFGIVSFSPCKKIEASLQEITDNLAELGKENIEEDQSFAVRARRTGNHDFSSKDVEEEAGRNIIEDTGAEVDLDNPDERVMADIRQGQCYIFREKIDGPGGLPLGTQGNVLSLFRGNCSSFLATWMMMKRGCSVTLIHGKMGPYAEEENIEKALEELKKWSHGSPIELLEFNHGDKIFNISESSEKGYVCTLCKRYLYKLASRISERKGCKAIITGDHLYEDMDMMKFEDSAVEIPIIRPLVGMDESKIRSKCEDIAGKSLLKGDKCEAKDRGNSKVNKEKLEEIESRINIKSMVEEGIEEMAENEETGS